MKLDTLNMTQFYLFIQVNHDSTG